MQRIQKTSAIIKKEIPECPISNGDILVEVGHPIRKIISIAEAGNYDFVIIGTHGNGKLENAIIGSVSSGVIRNCTKPVLVVSLP